MKKNPGDLTSEIERLISARNTTEAIREIARALRSTSDPGFLFQACDWYRRLGLDDVGFRLVAPSRLPSRAVPGDSQAGKELIWAARFLNLMGATDFALDILGRIELSSFEDCRIAGTIHQVNLDFQKAREYFERCREKDPDPESYASRVMAINLADCLAGLGDHSSALELVRKVRSRSTEPLLRGVALQAEGEYLARQGNFDQALRVLSEAFSFFPANDASPDFGILLKWLGYCEHRTGNGESGEKCLDAAFHLLRNGSIRPEAWLDVMRLKAELGLLPPASTKSLSRYPGISAGFQAQLESSFAKRRALSEATPQASASPSPRSVVIDLQSDECFLDGNRRLGIPLDLKALAFVRLAGPWGLPAVCLKALLWPGQAYAFLQLEGRLQQILHRLRNDRQVGINVTNGLIVMDRTDEERIVVEEEGLGPSLLRGKSAFSRQDVESHYKASMTLANSRIKEWEQQNLILRQGSGKNIRYRSVPRDV